MAETPRAEKVRLAMTRIQARGEQPSPGRVQRELGEVVRNGGDLNGRDSKTYARVMEAFGYVRVTGPRFTARWCRPEAASL